MVERQKQPAWLKPYMDTAGISKIEQAVAIVEKQTTGEIVPMIVSRSSAIGHVPFSMGLLLSLAWLLAAMLLPRDLLTYWMLIGLPAVPLFAVLFGRVPAIQRLFTHPADRAHQVALRAEIERLQAKMTTRRGTGILLFASLMERRAVVLADHGIAEKLPKEIWEEVVRLLVGGMRSGNADDGFVAAIRRSGELLTRYFPIGPEDHNELPNGLVIKT